MSTFLFFNVPAVGHINPTLGFIAELRRRGHRVVYYNAEAYQAKITQAGAEFRAYPSMDEYEHLAARAGRGDLANNAVSLLKIGEALLPFVQAEITREKPDAVIFDSLASWGRWGAELAGLPAIASITTFVLTPKNMPAMPVGATLRLAAGLVANTPAYLRVRSRVKRLGIRDAGLFNALMNRGALNLVYTSRAFQPKSEALGAEYAFVGTSLNERRETLDVPLDGRPLVYISLGTLHSPSRPFLESIFAAFGGMPVQVVVSVGQKARLDGLTPPVNVTLRPSVAQLEILKRAAVFVTHGGLNSTHEGLFYGVPLALIPQQAEQAVVAAQVEALGAGRVLRAPEQPTALRATVETLLGTDAYRVNAARLGETLRESGGASAAASAIERFISV